MLNFGRTNYGRTYTAIGRALVMLVRSPMKVVIQVDKMVKKAFGIGYCLWELKCDAIPVQITGKATLGALCTVLGKMPLNWKGFTKKCIGLAGLSYNERLDKLRLFPYRVGA